MSLQMPTAAQERVGAEASFRISSNLVLVDVIAFDVRTGIPIQGLHRDDFQIHDEGRPVTIATFDFANSARPLALWFVVQCNMQGWEAKGSGLFRGESDHLASGMKKLGQRDLVAVAHWCDDGTSAIDLKPTPDIGKAGSTLETALTPIPSPPSHDRIGELALQSVLSKIVEASRKLPSGPVPVVVFLYGDYSAMPKSEANRFVDALLQTSAVVYGLKDSRSPHLGSFWLGGEQSEIANYLARQTGGQYFAETPEKFGSAIQSILDQLQTRYEIGFNPVRLDGQRHQLHVDLTERAKKRYGQVGLRYRTAYVPMRDTQP